MLAESSGNTEGMPYADQKERNRRGDTHKRAKMDSSETEEQSNVRIKRSNNQENVPSAAPDGADDISGIESCIRFLVSSSAAGSVIGKGGSTISEFQAQSGARIQLSRTREYFPGTNDRIILLSGTVSGILTALHLILSKVAEDNGDEQQPAGANQAVKGQVRLVIPNAVCGAIIGKGGATIRSFVDDSGASIKLSSQEQALPGVSDRLVTIGGTLEQQLRAVALIVAKISEDPGYASYSSVPLSYPVFNAGSPGYGTGLRSTPFPGPRGKGPAPAGFPASGSGATTTLTVAVPDEHVGAMVGKGGRTLTEIQQVTSVHIKLSDRGDFVEGTNHRKVTITGSADGVVAAQQLISQKVQQNMSSNSSDFDGERDYRSRERDYRDRDREKGAGRVERYYERDRDREGDRRERAERERDWDRLRR